MEFKGWMKAQPATFLSPGSKLFVQYRETLKTQFSSSRLFAFWQKSKWPGFENVPFHHLKWQFWNFGMNRTTFRLHECFDCMIRLDGQMHFSSLVHLSIRTSLILHPSCIGTHFASCFSDKDPFVREKIIKTFPYGHVVKGTCIPSSPCPVWYLCTSYAELFFPTFPVLYSFIQRFVV